MFRVYTHCAQVRRPCAICVRAQIGLFTMARIYANGIFGLCSDQIRTESWRTPELGQEQILWQFHGRRDFVVSTCASYWEQSMIMKCCVTNTPTQSHSLSENKHGRTYTWARPISSLLFVAFSRRGTAETAELKEGEEESKNK